MSRNGSGIYSLAAGNPVVTATTVSSTWANGTLTDIASALTTSIASDGQTVISANIPMNSKKLTGLAAPTVAGDALSYGAVATISTLTTTADASINSIVVGLGGGSVAGNTTVGNSALSTNTAGTYNVAVGYASLNQNTASNNTAVGTSALQANTTGTANNAFGYQALKANTTASNNTAVGYQSGYSNQTGADNVSVGYQTLYNSTAGNNTAVGSQSAKATTTGIQNASFGRFSLSFNTTGSQNTALGDSAMYPNTTGSYNTAVGMQALNSNTTASNNTAVGYQALYSNVTGTPITAIGYQAGYACIAGYSVFLGNQAGNNLTTGQAGIYIGNNPTASAVGANNELNISTNGGAGKGSNTGLISPNGGGVYQGNNSAAWSITSDQRLKKNIVDNTTGLDAINAIQVRNFEYRLPEEVSELEAHCAIDIKGVQLGAIAQELQLILPECVKTESTGVMSVDATNLTWYLINAVKELSAKVTALEAKQVP